MYSFKDMLTSIALAPIIGLQLARLTTEIDIIANYEHYSTDHLLLATVQGILETKTSNTFLLAAAAVAAAMFRPC